MPNYPSLTLDALDGDSGAYIDGAAPRDEVGRSVQPAGDVNGDGLGDVIVSSGTLQGTVINYVVFGSTSGLPDDFTVAQLDGSNGFMIEGRPLEQFRYAEAAGDINGDGYADVMVSTVDRTVAGSTTQNTHFIFGSADGFGASVSVDDFDGANGFSVAGIAGAQQVYETVGAGGDVNGDGYADVLFSNYGQVHVLYGAADGFAPEIELADTQVDFDAGAVWGGPPASVGDINGDGYDDVSIASAIFFGSADGYDPTVNINTLDGSNGVSLWGTNYSDVEAAGDVNGDGIDDFMVSAPGDEAHGHPEAGQVYVVFGTDEGFDPNLDVTALDGSNGFVVRGGTLQHLGREIAAAGDVNGDGFDDIFVGGNGYYGYVVFGRANYHTPGFDADQLTGTYGFTIQYSAPYTTVSDGKGLGDFNGDGFGDMVFGNPAAQPGGVYNAGQAIVAYGEAPTSPVTRVDAAGDQTVLGGSSNDVLISYGGDDRLAGGLGNDSLRSVGGSDVLDGGLGDDEYFVFADHSDTIIDAGGIDTIRTTTHWDLRDNPTIENVVLAAAGHWTVTGNGLDNRITGSFGDNILKGLAGNDRLEGGHGDDILVGGTGRDILIGGEGADRFDFGEGDQSFTPGRDTITDFEQGLDRINLGAIDANVSRGGNQAFSFIGAGEFSGTGGELRLASLTYSNGDIVTLVEGDANGDGEANFQIELRGQHALTAGDFIL